MAASEHVRPSSRKVLSWTVEEVSTWLRSIELDSCIDSFLENAITGVTLPELDGEDLRAMGLNHDQRRIFRLALDAALNNAKAGDDTQIVWLGLGQMGRALVLRLLEVPKYTEPYTVQVWNRTWKATKKLSKEHARHNRTLNVMFHEDVQQALASKPTEDQVRIICTMLPNYSSTEQLLLENGEALDGKGTVLLCLNSGSPDEARSFASRVQQRWPDLLYIDGCFVGSPHAVLQGNGTLLYSTPKPLSAAVLRVLHQLSYRAESCVCSGSEYGSAKALDYALVDAFFLNYIAFAHATALADAESIPKDVLLQCLQNHTATFPTAWKRMAGQMDQSCYENKSASLQVWRDFFGHRSDYIASRSLSSVVPDLACSSIDRVLALSPGASLSDDLIRLQDIFRPSKRQIASSNQE